MTSTGTVTSAGKEATGVHEPGGGRGGSQSHRLGQGRLPQRGTLDLQANREGGVNRGD